MCTHKILWKKVNYMNLTDMRVAFYFTIKAVLDKKRERKAAYLRKQEELTKRCRNCPGASKGAWYCEDCTTGLRLHMLDAEYKDVNNWWK